LKKFFYLILLCLILFNTSGSWLLYQFERYRHYIATCKTLTSKSKNIILKLSRDEFVQCRSKKNEIIFRGEMYDFLKTEMHHDTIYIFCNRDFKEEGLVNAFFEFLTKQHQQHSDKLINHVLDYLMLILTIPENISITHFPVNKFHFSEWKSHFHSVIILIDSPPPECHGILISPHFPF